MQYCNRSSLSLSPSTHRQLHLRSQSPISPSLHCEMQMGILIFTPSVSEGGFRSLYQQFHLLKQVNFMFSLYQVNTFNLYNITNKESCCFSCLELEVMNFIFFFMCIVIYSNESLFWGQGGFVVSGNNDIALRMRGKERESTKRSRPIEDVTTGQDDAEDGIGDGREGSNCRRGEGHDIGVVPSQKWNRRRRR